MLNERRQLEELKLTITEERERRDREARNMRADMFALRTDHERLRYTISLMVSFPMQITNLPGVDNLLLSKLQMNTLLVIGI